MGTAGIELIIQLAISALAHITELQRLLSAAVAEGRDVTPEEIAAVRAKAVGAVDALDAQNQAAVRAVDALEQQNQSAGGP